MFIAPTVTAKISEIAIYNVKLLAVENPVYAVVEQQLIPTSLTVEVETDGGCVFPAFAIVSKFKSTPLKRGDGDIVCAVDENTEIKNSHTFEFTVQPLRPETRLKMFFLNDKNYKAVKIACKAGNSI